MAETLMYPQRPGTELIDVEPLRGRSVTRRHIIERVDEQVNPETIAEALRRLLAQGVVQEEARHPRDDKRKKRYLINPTKVLERIVESAERSRWVSDKQVARGKHAGVDMFLPVNSQGQLKSGFPLEAALQPQIQPAVLPVRLEIEVCTPGSQKEDSANDNDDPTIH